MRSQRLIIAASTYAATSLNKKELVFLTWPEYIDPDVVTAFEESRNVKIRFVYFQSDDTRDRLILDANGRGFDIALMNGIAINTYTKRGWLAPITEAEVPNLRHIIPRWRNAFENANQYAMPYLWGTVGIAYRTDLIEEKITSWKQFFNPAKSIGTSIVMIDSSREVIGMALKSLGYSINTKNLAEIRQAEKLLHQQKPFVKDYSYINITEISSLVTGETSMALVFNGDAMAIQEYEENIAFVLPKEGSLLWADYLTVLASSEKKALAFDLINYLNETDVATKISLFSYYATPHREAEKKLPKTFLSNPSIYPDERALERSEAERPLTPRAAKEYGRIMSILTRK